MKTFHWASLGVASSMVTVLISASILMPSPKGTFAAKATFAPVSLEDIAKNATTRFDPNASNDHTISTGLGNFDTSSGSVTPNRELDSLSYDLDAVIKGHGVVPRITLASLPSDIAGIRETSERKAVFFKTVLPLVLQVNEQILKDRKRLWSLATKVQAGTAIEAVDRLWLVVMAERYGVQRGDISGLLNRHDVVPPSLAIAQAATESAWGTSRFVQEGNAMFGQWTFTAKDAGIVPNGRTQGKTHRIRAFDNLYDSVASYVLNLNKHRAYKEFRQARADMRAKGKTLDGMRLASTLHRYSERGAAYVSELHAIIGGNDLTLFDGARLSRIASTEPLI